MTPRNTNPAGNPRITERAPGSPAHAGKSPEYQRFEDLTRRLAKVPKSELDEKRQKA